MINDGLLDQTYIVQEAARRKQDIDRALSLQLAELEDECQHRYASIKQQAEHHTRLSEEQIRSHMRNYIAHVTGQAEAQALEVSRRTKEEKERLGQDASLAIAQVVERTKAAVLHRQMRATESMHFESQQMMANQTQAMQQEMAMQMRRRHIEIDQDQKQAYSSIFCAPAVPPVR